MIKYLIVDHREIQGTSNAVLRFLEITDHSQIKNILPILLPTPDNDYRVDTGLWDVLGIILSENQFSKLDYGMVSYIVENSTELIQHILNETFNMPETTYYSFKEWIGNDIKLEVHDDY